MPPTKGESRYTIDGAVCLDSATLLVPEDRGRIVATGSHGALNSAKATAPFRPLLLMFNDAGFGADRGGALALPELDKEGLRRHRSRNAIRPQSATAVPHCRTARFPTRMMPHTGSARVWTAPHLHWRAHWPKKRAHAVRETFRAWPSSM